MVLWEKICWCSNSYHHRTWPWRSWQMWLVTLMGVGGCLRQFDWCLYKKRKFGSKLNSFLQEMICLSKNQQKISFLLVTKIYKNWYRLTRKWANWSIKKEKPRKSQKNMQPWCLVFQKYWERRKESFLKIKFL